MRHLFDKVYLDSSLVLELIAAVFRVQSHEYLLTKKPESKDYTSPELEQWVKEVREDLPRAMKKEMSIFFNHETYLGVSLSQIALENNVLYNVEEFFSFLENVSPLTILQCFFITGFADSMEELKKARSISNQEEALDYLKKKNFPEEEKWKMHFLFADREHTKNRLIRLLKEFYYKYFVDHIHTLKKIHESSLLEMEKELAEGGQEKVKLLLEFEYEDLQLVNKLIFFPSYYYNTTRMISYADMTNIWFYLYGVNQLEITLHKEENESRIIEAIKALSDENRIKIIQILNNTPCYGYELGQKLNLSNSTISHHLAILSRLGIIRSRRHENKIYYEVDQEIISEIFLNATKLLTN